MLYVPNLACNLISVSQLIHDSNCAVTFSDKLCVIQDRTSRIVIGLGEQRNGVYHFRAVTFVQACKTSGVDSFTMWHRRLGHAESQIVSLLHNIHVGEKDKQGQVCDICLRAKQTRDIFIPSQNKANEPFDLIHCDVWGPYRVRSSCGASYFLTIVDDFSRAVWIYLLVEKSEVANTLKNFCTMVVTQFNRKVKIVRSDNGTEFRVMRGYFVEQGIIYQTSMVDTPQQNGRVERKHRHILNVARALRFQANLPIDFWGECVLTAGYLINRTPSLILKGKSPYEILFGQTPTYSHFRIFGYLCYAHNRPRKKDKFGERSRKCIFVGYPYGKKGWRLYDLDSGEYFESRDVVFCENEFPFLTNVSDVQDDSNPSTLWNDGPPLIDEPRMGMHDARGSRSIEESVGNTQDVILTQRQSVEDLMSTPHVNEQLGRGHRERHPPSKLKDYICHTVSCANDPTPESHPQSQSSGTLYPITNYVTCTNFSMSHRQFLAAVTSGHEPTRFSEAVRDPLWRDAMKQEIDALEKNSTWTLAKLPPGKKAIGCKWVYKIKYKSDGSVERHKARLVVRGDNQKEGIDYNETFAPVAKMVTVRTLLAVAAARSWILHQMDVHNAFLHGDLDEEVYMQLPPGFSCEDSKKVCKLQKSLYGLRQAPRNWFAKLAAALKDYGFQQSRADYSLFTYHSGGVILSVLVYVDDLIIAGSDEDVIERFKRYLSTCFYMKDLGSLKYFLGLEVARGPQGIFLCQRKYALDIISETGLLEAKPASSPLEQNHRLALVNGAILTDPEQYRRLVGRLIYLTISRPELSYSVHVLAQFMQCPRQEHWEAATRVVRYLKSNPGQGIFLRSDSDLKLYAYCDSDWASCPLTRRSLTGYFVFLGRSPISWKTKKQATVSRSSAEAEYRSMATTISELKWLKALLIDLQVPHLQPMRLFCDSQAAIHIAANPVFHERTKHIEVDCHYIRDEIQHGDVVTMHVRTYNQLADILTKALGKQQFDFLLGKLGIRNPHAPT